MDDQRTEQASRSAREIHRNIAVHDRIVQRYEQVHGEIYNDLEQDRIRRTLTRARDAVRTDSEELRALDVGCGSGNLTHHLTELGLRVTAADVSQGCLDFVCNRHPGVEAMLLNGTDLAGVADCSFDVVATYSVLHHIPDYAQTVREMGRVCKVGGVIVIDHEPSEGYWTPDPTYQAFRAEALKMDWGKYLRPSNYLHRLRRLFNPRHTNEGDIHVWPDDHVEWQVIRDILHPPRFEVVEEENYLLNRRQYRREVFSRYAGRCSDTKVMIFRRCAA